MYSEREIDGIAHVMRMHGQKKLANGMIAIGLEKCPSCNRVAFELRGKRDIYCYHEDIVIDLHAPWERARKLIAKKVR